MIFPHLPSSLVNSAGSATNRCRSKSQKAMKAVLDVDANHKTESQLARENGVDRSYINMARAVLEYMPDQVDAIIDGRTSLAASYITLKARKAVLEAAAKLSPQQIRDAKIEEHNRKVWTTGRE
jgi:hypothetical protein